MKLQRSAMNTASSGPSPTSVATLEAVSADAGTDSEPKRRDRSYTTGEMARLSNNTLRTVRFYEEAGILRPIGRTEGGHRLFERTELDRLMLVSDMREAGLSLEEIRNVLETKQLAGSGPEAARSAIEALQKYMVELKRKVDVLTRLHDDLAESVDVAARCLECTHENLFPSRCNECDKMSDDKEKPLPRAMRVLWTLSTPSGRNGASAPTATEPAEPVAAAAEAGSAQGGGLRSSGVRARPGLKRRS